MFLRVAYSDGTIGLITSSILGFLSKSGKIIAYQCSDGWIEVRRKQNNANYSGPERRKADLPIFNS